MRRAVLAVALLAVGAAGCMPKFSRPEVELAGVRLGGVGLQGGLLYVRLEVYNPNGFDLGAAGLSYNLDLADPDADGDDTWIDLAQGDFRQDIRLQDNARTIVEIPVEFTYRAAGAALRSLLASGTFEYRVEGEVDVTSPVRRSLPFRRLGTVTMTGDDF